MSSFSALLLVVFITSHLGIAMDSSVWSVDWITNCISFGLIMIQKKTAFKNKSLLNRLIAELQIKNLQLFEHLFELHVYDLFNMYDTDTDENLEFWSDCKYKIQCDQLAIKKMCNQNIIISDEKMDSVGETLILRNLKTRNSLVRDIIVNYIDLFQCKSNFYVVMELNFSVTLKEFVLQSLEYIKKGQLLLKHYRETIKYLLWRIITTVHWLHIDTKMNCPDLDLCQENIMLSQAEFIGNTNNNNLLEINLQIEMKLIDVGVREIAEIGAKEELKTFEYMYNIKYLSENNQYILPNNNILLDNPQTYDIWAYGMVVYFCFLGVFPYKKIPNTDDIANKYGFYAVCNGKLKQYFSYAKCIEKY